MFIKDLPIEEFVRRYNEGAPHSVKKSVFSVAGKTYAKHRELTAAGSVYTRDKPLCLPADVAFVDVMDELVGAVVVYLSFIRDGVVYGLNVDDFLLNDIYETFHKTP